MSRFIVVEGIDGSGTSTQARSITEGLVARGDSARVTAEPTDRPVGRLIRELLAGRHDLSSSESANSRLFAYLFAADRLDHLENDTDGVKASLARGENVVCARYVLSSLAYEADDPELESFVQSLNDSFLVPDLTLYLDCPVEVSLERIRSTRDHLDVFENPTKLERVKAAYDRIIGHWPGTILRIDATIPRQEITAQVLEALDADIA